MKTERIGALVLQETLERGADFEPGTRQVESHTATRETTGIDRRGGDESREVGGVIETHMRMNGEAAAGHYSGARITGPNADGKNQRVRLEVAYPDRIEPL